MIPIQQRAPYSQPLLYDFSDNKTLDLRRFELYHRRSMRLAFVYDMLYFQQYAQTPNDFFLFFFCISRVVFGFIFAWN